MPKKIISLVLCVFIFIMGMAVFANAADGDMSIVLQIENTNMTVNGVNKEIDAAPVIVDGRTLLPVRAVVEEIGGDVSWNSEAKQATLNHGENEIVLTIDSETALLNNEEQKLDTAPVIISGRTFLPIRFIAENFGYNVEWSEDDRSITITNSVVDTLTSVTEVAIELSTEELKTTETTDSENILIVYFSRTGTTKKLAEDIHNKVGGDIAEITPVEAYPDDYDECIEQAQREIEEDARPAYTVDISDISKYDVVFVGYPIWWNTVPPVVKTFLESTDLSGKTVMPFCTHGGSGIRGSMTAINELCPDSVVINGLDDNEDYAIDQWLKNNNFDLD